MNKLIPKHLRKSPVSFNYKQYISTLPIGIKVVDNAILKTEQLRNLRNILKRKGVSLKIGAASLTALKEEVKRRLRILAEAGYYKGKIDGIWGKKSKAALATFDKNNKKSVRDPNLSYVEITNQNGDIINSYYEPLTDKRRKEIEKADELRKKREFQIPEEDREAFAKYLYLLGLKNVVNNILGSGLTFVKNVLGIGDNAFPSSKGMRQQAIALHLFDTNGIQDKGNGYKLHILGYIPGTTDYKWHLLDGLNDVDASIGLVEKLARHPAEFTYGLYKLVETPEIYTIKDTYNFNQEGTDASKDKVNAGNASTYLKVRYYAGEYGANKDLKVDVKIPKELIYDWYQEFKNQNR